MSGAVDEASAAERARRTATVLYEGKVVRHRSCGIAVAETFGRPTAAYQALRKGGITGCGECGAVVAGRLVLGEVLGDSDPTGGVTPALRAGAVAYEERIRARLDRGAAPGDGIICNTLTGPFADFLSPERAAFCTRIAAEAAATVAEVLEEQAAAVEITTVDS